jgi:putative heme iron utilization protein
MADSPSDSALARELLRSASTAALATLGADGGPFASHVTVAAAASGEPLMLLSRLAVHTRNLERDARASLLFVRPPPAGTTALAAERLTLTGVVQRDGAPAARETFLARHPDASHYAGLSDFSIYRFEIRSAHLVAGFGRIAGISPAELTVPEGSPSSRLTKMR